ncbi:MAG: glycerophosphodiester phosphodiesterase [Candidatus Lokiarchaeota archaeon]|nr:glycerophosphodiester phosphodiesterase [Candidatus Lokiarchaeota archaeon]
MDPFSFEIIGHRGCEGLAPENSIAAMRKAIDLGIDRVEFDINKTRDGTLVVMHDGAIHAGGKKVPVEALDRSAILQAKGVQADEVPLLDEVLATCKGKIRIQAELKAENIETSVVAAIQKAGFPLADASISSFDLSRLERVHGHLPSLDPVQLVLLLSKGKDAAGVLGDMRRAGVGTISIHASRVSRDLVAFLHDGGIRVLSWGVGEMGLPRRDVKKRYGLLLTKGVDGFTCAYPDVLKEIRANRRGY